MTAHNNKKMSGITRNFFVAVLLFGFALIYIIFKPFLVALVLAAIFCTFFQPVHRYFLRQFNKQATWSSLASTFAVLTFFIVPMLLILMLVLHEASAFYDTVSLNPELLREKIAAGREWLLSKPLMQNRLVEKVTSDLMNWPEKFAATGKAVSAWLIHSLQRTTQGLLKLMLTVAIMLFSMYYFFKDGPALLRRLKYLSPLYNRDEQVMLDQLAVSIRASLKCTLVIGVMQGTLGGLAFWALGLPSPFFFGLAMTLFSVIPGIGTSIIWGPAAVYLLLSGHGWKALILAAYGGLVISLVDNLVRPQLLGKGLQLHPLLILLATLGGVAAFGIVGFILGPTIVSGVLVILRIYSEEFREELEKAAAS